VRPALSAAFALFVMAAPAVADVAYVTCQSDDKLSVIDLNAPDARVDWRVLGKPAGVAVGVSGDVYTVSADSKTVRRWSAATATIAADVVLDGGPIGVALEAARNRLFVSDWYNARIWVLDAGSLALLGELPTGTAPAGLAISPDGAWLASADKNANSVSVFDLKTLELRHRVDVGERPFGLRFAQDGRLFVGNVGSNDVSVIDPVAGAVLATVPVGERPYGVTFAKGRAFVTNQYANTVSVIDLDSLDAIETIEVGEYPEGIDTTTDGNAVVLANWFDNTLSIIDTSSLSVVETVSTCDGPRAFGTFLLQ